MIILHFHLQPQFRNELFHILHIHITVIHITIIIPLCVLMLCIKGQSISFHVSFKTTC